MLIGSSENYYASSFSIIIDGPGLTTTANFDIKSVTGLEVDHNVEQPDENSRTSVIFDRGEFGFEVFDRMSNGDSFFAVLNSEITSADSVITASVSVTTRVGARTFTDRFVFTKKDMESTSNARDTKITARLGFDIDLSKTVEQYFTDDASEIVPIDLTGNGIKDHDGVLAGTFINDVLSKINTAANIINNSIWFSSTDSSARGGGNHFCLINDGLADKQTIGQLFFQMAASEGSVFGTMMGDTYFTERRSGSANTITTADIEKGSLVLKPSDGDVYRGISVIFKSSSGNFVDWASDSDADSGVDTGSSNNQGDEVISTDATGGEFDANDLIYFGDDNREIYIVAEPNTGSQVAVTRPLAFNVASGLDVMKIDVLNIYGRKSLALRYVSPILARVTYNSGSSMYNDLSDSPGVANDGVASNSAVLGAEKQAKVGFTVLGIEKVRPYQEITLDNSFPASVANKTFFVETFKADYMNDKVEIELHEI